MATLYYDFNAPVNGAGTPTSPRNTWATPGNGDVILIRRGCTWTRTTQLNLSTFTSLTFDTWFNSDGSDDSTQPKPLIVHTAASTFAWNFQGAGTHTIKNLHFLNCSTNLNGGVIGSGLVAATSKGANFIIDNCVFENIAYNAIRLSRTGVESADTFSCYNCTFLNIGEDAVYGGAVRYEFGYNRVVGVSTNTDSGDAVGFLGTTPTLAWIHNNYIDHSSHPYKHCIIVDSATTDSGLAIIEDNVLIGPTGFGIENSTGVNSDARAIVRRNTIYTGRVAVNLAGNNSECYSNVIYVLESDGTTVAVGIDADGVQCYNNTFDNPDKISTLIGTTAAGTNAVIRNNAVKRANRIYQRGAVSETLATNAYEDVNTLYAAGTSTGDIQVVMSDDLRIQTPEAYTNGTDVGYIRDRNKLQSKKHIGAYGRARTA